MIFVYPPSIFPDASRGFQVMRSIQMGGGFNMLVSPSQDAIASNASQFLTWWSPGQYLIPYFLKWIFSVNTGQASVLTIFIFQLSGLAGFYFFFKKAGFSPIIAAISLAFIVCQVAFIVPYVFYNGGELLLFGFEGWFMYGCIAIKKPGFKLILFVLLSGWAGFFCKSSFMWIYGAGLLCLWIRLSGKWNIGRYIKNGFWVFVPAAISLAAIYIFFLSKGDNPAADSTGFSLTWQTFSFPLASPLLAGFSVDDLFQGLVNHPAMPMCYIIAILLLLAIISILLVMCIVKYVPDRNYRIFIIVFYTVSILFFTLAYLRQLNISYEGRHFRLIGLLIVPGVIYLISKLKAPFKIVFGLVCTSIAVMSFVFFIKGYTFNKNISARGNSGMAQADITQSALNYILTLDRQTQNAVFVFTDPFLGLEIAHNRMITIDMPETGTDIDPYDYLYDGHAGPLYILVPANYKASQVAMLLKFFPGYNNFSAKKLSGYVLYSAK